MAVDIYHCGLLKSPIIQFYKPFKETFKLTMKKPYNLTFVPFGSKQGKLEYLSLRYLYWMSILTKSSFLTGGVVFSDSASSACS